MTVLGVSLKMYLSAADTRRWLADVGAAVAARPPGPDVFVLPSFPLLESALSMLAGTAVAVGAQDVAASEDGAQTGSVSAALLVELGCRYVAVGHAERRARFGEDDATTAAKAANAVAHGLVPVVCIGETERLDPERAAAFCRSQLEPVLTACIGAPLVVAYEPVWAIGAERPAPTDHVRAVADRLRGATGDRRLIYGGSAGPGLFAELDGAVDGLFLGRFAHDPTAFTTVLDQMIPTTQEIAS